MEHRLFVLLLFTGVFPLVLSVTRKYYLIQEGRTWNDAQAYCRAKYTDLATIDSDNNMVQLQKVAQTQLFTSDAWIGLYTNINSWHWSLENEPLGSFTSWNMINPNNYLGNELCVIVYLFQWVDRPCHSLYYFVCFDDTKTGSDKYILISQAKTWYDAQRYCREQYTDLASARDATENNIIGRKNSGHYIWFGLNRDPCKWSDQTTNVSIIKWQGGNSEDYSMNRSCGYLYGLLAGQAECSSIKPFFCYTFPTVQQTISMKVKSSQDVNDPAIMAAILEKIKEKMEDHGMNENIFVKWRVHQDVVVFHKEKENTTTVVNKNREACEL
ncbi:putative C-type lectin domain family 20 member A [Ictalurus punctatus]|uniref:C-type lectin domain family 20 member A n=1 Tax=Ictalurus punctatus TaxID=7998 RepID=A0A2D0QRU6_ICTPU|nr:putative C-type lectin domain family 20 member A [Ictalurus punctatus]